jgi:transposase
LAASRRLAQRFAALVPERPGETAYRAWLAEAISSGISRQGSFAAGLRHDDAAVVAGLTMPWSSGVVEGHNARIKLISARCTGADGSICSGDECSWRVEPPLCL